MNRKGWAVRVNRKEKTVGLFTLGVTLVVVAGFAIAAAHMGWLTPVRHLPVLHWVGHGLRLAAHWLQDVVNWLTIPFKWMFIFILGLIAGSWLQLSSWLNPILGIPEPANFLERLEPTTSRRRRRRRGLSPVDIDDLVSRLESVADKYGLTPQICMDGKVLRLTVYLIECQA